MNNVLDIKSLDNYELTLYKDRLIKNLKNIKKLSNIQHYSTLFGCCTGFAAGERLLFHYNENTSLMFIGFALNIAALGLIYSSINNTKHKEDEIENELNQIENEKKLRKIKEKSYI